MFVIASEKCFIILLSVLQQVTSKPVINLNWLNIFNCKCKRYLTTAITWTRNKSSTVYDLTHHLCMCWFQYVVCITQKHERPDNSITFQQG